MNIYTILKLSNFKELKLNLELKIFRVTKKSHKKKAKRKHPDVYKTEISA